MDELTEIGETDRDLSRSAGPCAIGPPSFFSVVSLSRSPGALGSQPRGAKGRSCRSGLRRRRPWAATRDLPEGSLTQDEEALGAVGSHAVFF
jgi:hypothetical protein